jgi:antitoxin component YwqK of YwqJK toxin-antitoxin module
MKHKITLLSMLLLVVCTIQAQTSKKTPQLYQNEGIYYRDRAQNELYTGDYREYYDNNTLKLEMQIKNGLPEGTYIIYFENRKPQEIRSYREGKLHG